MSSSATTRCVILEDYGMSLDNVANDDTVMITRPEWERIFSQESYRLSLNGVRRYLISLLLGSRTSVLFLLFSYIHSM